MKKLVLTFAIFAMYGSVAVGSKLISECYNGNNQSCGELFMHYSNLCNKNDGKGCFNLGNSYYNGQGVRQDYKKASELYKKACDLGNGSGCNNLGVLYKNGRGVRQDYKKANELYQKACDLGDGGGCLNLGGFI